MILEQLHTMWSVLASTGLLGAIGLVLRYRSESRLERDRATRLGAEVRHEQERAQRIEAEAEAAQSTAVVEAYRNARADLETAKIMYEAVRVQERECRDRYNALEERMTAQARAWSDREQACERAIAALRSELDEVRHQVVSGHSTPGTVRAPAARDPNAASYRHLPALVRTEEG